MNGIVGVRSSATFDFPPCFITIKFGRRVPYDSFIVNPNCRKVTFYRYIKSKLSDVDIRVTGANEKLDLCGLPGGYLNLSQMGDDEYVTEKIEPGQTYYPIAVECFPSGNLRSFRLLYKKPTKSAQSSSDSHASMDDLALQQRLRDVMQAAAKRSIKLEELANRRQSSDCGSRAGLMWRKKSAEPASLADVVGKRKDSFRKLKGLSKLKVAVKTVGAQQKPAMAGFRLPSVSKPPADAPDK